MLESAFNSLLKLHGRDATLRRMNPVGTSPTSITTAIRISSSNYFRKVNGPSETTVKGRELVISKAFIVSPFTPILKLGDRIEDSEWGNMAIIEIQEMADFGGKVMAYRVRCE